MPLLPTNYQSWHHSDKSSPPGVEYASVNWVSISLLPVWRQAITWSPELMMNYCQSNPRNKLQFRIGIHNFSCMKKLKMPLKICSAKWWPFYLGLNWLTHWGRATHICVSKLTIIASDNGLSPGRRQAIIWNNAGILWLGLLGTNFSEILIEILTFSFNKMRLKVWSAKWRPFCLGLNVLSNTWPDCLYSWLPQIVEYLFYTRPIVRGKKHQNYFFLHT